MCRSDFYERKAFLLAVEESEAHPGHWDRHWNLGDGDRLVQRTLIQLALTDNIPGDMFPQADVSNNLRHLGAIS